jgi:hypothetical protein
MFFFISGRHGTREPIFCITAVSTTYFDIGYFLTTCSALFPDNMGPVKEPNLKATVFFESEERLTFLLSKWEGIGSSRHELLVQNTPFLLMISL